jgi:hypothetical protein
MNTLRSAIFTLGLLLVVSAAHAQTTNVLARIPFDFMVGKQMLPAGEYTLKSLDQISNALVIRGEQGATQITLTHAAAKSEPAEKTVLIFHRVGDEYFLAEVWVEGNSSGRALPKSPVETQMAMNHKDGESVIVAALINR